MGALSGSASDRIRKGGGQHTSPERPDMERTSNTTPHEGHQLSKPGRKVTKP